MPLLMLKDLPRYERLLEAAKQNPDLDPSACEVFMNLLRTGDEVFHLMHAHYHGHSISQGRFVVLLLLFDQLAGCSAAHTPAEIAEKAGVTRATMTGLIDTLERDGLVHREPDLADRRRSFVSLTKKGDAFIKTLLPVHFRRIAELMSPLDEKERKTLVRLLNKIIERTAALTPAASSEIPALASAGEAISLT
jgi:DNA-binding MarR family transcriptional regulator